MADTSTKSKVGGPATKKKGGKKLSGIAAAKRRFAKQANTEVVIKMKDKDGQVINFEEDEADENDDDAADVEGEENKTSSASQQRKGKPILECRSVIDALCINMKGVAVPALGDKPSAGSAIKSTTTGNTEEKNV